MNEVPAEIIGEQRPEEKIALLTVGG